MRRDGARAVVGAALLFAAGGHAEARGARSQSVWYGAVFVDPTESTPRARDSLAADAVGYAFRLPPGTPVDFHLVGVSTGTQEPAYRLDAVPSAARRERIAREQKRRAAANRLAAALRARDEQLPPTQRRDRERSCIAASLHQLTRLAQRQRSADEIAIIYVSDMIEDCNGFRVDPALSPRDSVGVDRTARRLRVEMGGAIDPELASRTRIFVLMPPRHYVDRDRPAPELLEAVWTRAFRAAGITTRVCFALGCLEDVAPPP
jgi:hypothetical protein